MNVPLSTKLSFKLLNRYVQGKEVPFEKRLHCTQSVSILWDSSAGSVTKLQRGLKKYKANSDKPKCMRWEDSGISQECSWNITASPNSCELMITTPCTLWDGVCGLVAIGLTVPGLKCPVGQNVVSILCLFKCMMYIWKHTCGWLIESSLYLCLQGSSLCGRYGIQQSLDNKYGWYNSFTFLTSSNSWN